MFFLNIEFPKYHKIFLDIGNRIRGSCINKKGLPKSKIEPQPHPVDQAFLEKENKDWFPTTQESISGDLHNEI